jgi:hypothetical protein
MKSMAASRQRDAATITILITFPDFYVAEFARIQILSGVCLNFGEFSYRLNLRQRDDFAVLAARQPTVHFGINIITDSVDRPIAHAHQDNA